jgi:hypothetical protein
MELLFREGNTFPGWIGDNMHASSAPLCQRWQAFSWLNLRMLISTCACTLFLTRAAGRLWAAGENKEGQCGLGTPLEELARQHRQAYDNALRRLRLDTQQVRGLLKLVS